MAAFDFCSRRVVAIDIDGSESGNSGFKVGRVEGAAQPRVEARHNGVLERVPYQDNPPRTEYRLTEKGRDLWHVLTAMRQWGDRWVAPDGPPLNMRHATCGRVVKAVAVCSHCDEPLNLRSITVEPGPGAVAADYERTVLESYTR